jgi:hypothetical protein
MARLLLRLHYRFRADITIYMFEGEAIQLPEANDPYDPEPGVVEPAVSNWPKAFAGAQWTFIGFRTDQTMYEYFFFSGITAPFPLVCPFVPPWTITVKRDGTVLETTYGNTWKKIDFNGHCGYQLAVKPPGPYEILAPGNYEFRFSQPAYGQRRCEDVSPQRVQCRGVYRRCTPRGTRATRTTSTRPCSPIIRQHSPMATPSRASLQGHTRKRVLDAWKRFFKGPPQTEHFYSYSNDDAALVQAYGWVYERDEGLRVFVAAGRHCAAHAV